MATRVRGSLCFIAAIGLIAGGGSATAATITIYIPEFSGPLPVGTFPRPAVDAGTFLFAVPIDDIITASVSGTFGNSQSPSSAGVNVFFDSLLVAQCVPSAPCTQVPGPDSWSYVFTAAQIDALLNDGIGQLTAVQTGPVFIRLGNLTLTLETPSEPVPEPASVGLLAAGVLAMMLDRIRRRRSPVGRR